MTKLFLLFSFVISSLIIIFAKESTRVFDLYGLTQEEREI